MAKKFGLGTALAIGAVAAAVGGGVAAYLNRESIKRTVQDIADTLNAREEDGFFSAETEDDIVVHPMDRATGSDESDFVDTDGVAEESAPAEEAAEEPAEEPAPAAD